MHDILPVEMLCRLKEFFIENVEVNQFEAYNNNIIAEDISNRELVDWFVKTVTAEPALWTLEEHIKAVFEPVVSS